MYCLHCGDCCLRMSPLYAPEPCQHIVRHENFIFCKIYDKRPVECKKHDFPYHICPIGMEKLNLQNMDAVRKRIDDGYEITKGLKHGNY